MFQRVRSKALYLGLALLLLPGALHAAATITGTVTSPDGQPLEGVTIFVESVEARTGADGRYTVSPAPTGQQVLVVFAEGYRTDNRPVDVGPEGSLTEDFVLEVDFLYSDTLIVTGTRSPQTKRESSFSITTLNSAQIAERAPRSTADLLRVIPGFYVESSGGEVGGNLWARGIPADGSYRYVALMEDGMPVYEATELSFVNADIFIRFDLNVAEM